MLISYRKLAVWLGLGLLLCGCDARGNNMELDQMATQAIEDIVALPDVSVTPCSLLTTERDYRYQYCFQDNSGSTAETVKEMRRAMVKAGFKSGSQGSDSSEIDTGYTVPGTPYSVNITFSASGFSWRAYDDNLTTPQNS